MTTQLSAGIERKRRFPPPVSMDAGRVEFMTVVEVDGGPRLELPEEPVDVRIGLRDALLQGKDWRAGFADDICLAVWLWRLWQPALEPYGVSREDFVDHTMAYRHEVWLWLMGERQWLPFVTGLAGRVVRRLPASSPA
jgi:hypothetical protein